METPDQSSGVISGTTISQSGEIVLAKFEALTSHTGDSTSQLSTEQIGEQVLGYLEVQPSEVQLVQDSNTIYLQPQEIEIDGEHLILTQGEEAGEIIVVVSTDQEHSADQAVAELAQGTVVNATMMHSESGDNKPRMFVVNQSNAQFDVVSDDGKMASVRTNVESEQAVKPVSEPLLIPVQNNQTESNENKNVDSDNQQLDSAKTSSDKVESASESKEIANIPKIVLNSEEELRDRKLMELACLAQEMRKEEICTDTESVTNKEETKQENTTENTIEKPSENIEDQQKNSKNYESTSKTDVTVTDDNVESTSKDVLKSNPGISNFPETNVEITDISESSNAEMSTTINTNQNLGPEIEETENVRDLQQDNLPLDEFSQISQNDQSVPNEASLINASENTSLMVPDKSTEQNPISPDTTIYSQDTHQITNIESQYGESQCINVSDSVENNEVKSPLTETNNEEKDSVSSSQDNENTASEFQETSKNGLSSANVSQGEKSENYLSENKEKLSESEETKVLQNNSNANPINELTEMNQTETRLETVSGLVNTDNDQIELNEFNTDSVKNDSADENSAEEPSNECKIVSSSADTNSQSKNDSNIIEETIKCVQDVINTTEKILRVSVNDVNRNKPVEDTVTKPPESSQIVTGESSIDNSSDQVVPQIEVNEITEGDTDTSESTQDKNISIPVKSDNVENFKSSENQSDKESIIKSDIKQQQQKNEDVLKTIPITEKSKACDSKSDNENQIALQQNKIQTKTDKVTDSVKDKSPVSVVLQYVNQGKSRVSKSPKSEPQKEQSTLTTRSAAARQKQGRYPVVIHLRDSIAKNQPEKVQNNEGGDKINKPASKENEITKIEEKKIMSQNLSEKVTTRSKELVENERDTFKEQTLNEEKKSECVSDKLKVTNVNEKLNKENEARSVVPMIPEPPKIIERDEELDEIIDEGLRRCAEMKRSLKANADAKQNLNNVEEKKYEEKTIEKNIKENDEKMNENDLDHLKAVDDDSKHKAKNELTLQTTLSEADASFQLVSESSDEKSECLTPKIQKQFQLLISPEKSDVEVDLTSIKSKISQKLQYDSVSELNECQNDTDVMHEEQLSSELKQKKLDSEIQTSVDSTRTILSNDKSSEVALDDSTLETPKRRGRKRRTTAESSSEKKTKKMDTMDDTETTDKEPQGRKSSPRKKGRKRKNELECEQQKQQKLDFDKLTEKKTDVNLDNKQAKSPAQKSWFLRPRGSSSKELPVNSVNEKTSNILNVSDNNENKLNEQTVLNQTPIVYHNSVIDDTQNTISSSVPQDQLNDDSDKSEISEDQVSRPVLMTRNEFLNSSSLSSKNKRQYSRKHIKSKSVNLSVQKAQSPRKYSPKSKTDSSVTLQRKKHIRSKTESALQILPDLKESCASPVKVCDFRIRCQTPSTPSEKSLTYSCVGCCFQTSRVQNLIHHYREKCLYTGPDAFHWDVDQLEGARKEESMKPKENTVNTKHIIDATSKSAVTSRIQNATKQRQIKSGNNLDKEENSDSDLDDLPPAFDTPSKKKFGFTDDDVVWVEWKNLHWPALVRKIYMKQKKASIMFIDSPSSKKPGIRVPIKKISTFDNAERNKKFLSAGRVTSHADTLVKAVQKAEDFLRKRCLGVNITAAQFFGNLDDIPDYISDVGSSTGTPSEPDSSARERHLSEVSSSRSISPALRLTQEEQAKDTESLPGESNEGSDPEALARRKERRKHQNAKLLQCIKAGKIETHLLGVYRSTIPSERHKLFHSNVASERNKLKHVSWFGPIDDEEQQEEIYDYCLQLFKSSCEYKDTFDVVAYMFEVWVPEAIVRAIARVRRVKMNQAENIFSRGVNWSKAEKEEAKREFENFQLTEEERQEHRENMADSLRIAGVKEDIIQSLNL
ncbi:putative leucine-rich repeat-containing protein DDB_G0290503 [Centruroides vittatus]|uniref:putative leucine-rich repeat-containing protein DDB_G0290503 n=1 Tax=Centruroides vittatus TaxID=120091 RepID=UPI0035108317